VVRVAVLSLATAIGLGLVGRGRAVGDGRQPGALAVIRIVIAGFALTVFVFHLSRIGPALRLRRESARSGDPSAPRAT
jgi:hypothetical protein